MRPVSVFVGSDSLSLKDVSGKVVSFAVEGDGTEAIDQMVDVVWQRIDSWGIAGANAFWKPNLVVTVQDGAQPQFNAIKKLLHKSGLGIQEVGQ